MEYLAYLFLHSYSPFSSKIALSAFGQKKAYHPIDQLSSEKPTKKNIATSDVVDRQERYSLLIESKVLFKFLS